MATVTRTLAFTDLESFTQKVAATDRDGLIRILDEHKALVRPVVERFGGHIVKNLGDSFLISFPSATDGLRAGLEVLRMAVGADGPRIRLALNTGDVEEIEGDVFGEAVNVASRILGKVGPGELWFGPGTRVCMNASEIPWESVGRFQMKGVEGEKELYRAVPPHRCWLPKPVEDAVKRQSLVRLRRGGSVPMLPPEPIVLIEGYAPGSPALTQAIEALPVIAPASMWLVAYNISGADRVAWTSEGRGLVIGTPESMDQAIRDVQRTSVRTSGSDTIVIENVLQADLELVMAGLALPAVPLSDVVQSYSYDLQADGSWANRSDRAVLRADVQPSGVTVHALAPSVSINGRALAPGESAALRDGMQLGTPSGSIRFIQPDHEYAGLMLADTRMRLAVVTGQKAELGREPGAPGLPFLDRKGQDNIRWCPGARAQRAKAGQFTLDRAMAGRRQAQVEVIDGEAEITSLHERCATWLLREGSVRLEKVDTSLRGKVGDLIVAGTTVVALRAPG